MVMPVTQTLKRTVALLFFLYASCVIPLYFQNMYFDILEAKRNAFFLLAGCLLPVTLGLFFAGLRERKPRFAPMDLFVLGFGLWALVSALCSGSPRASFWGTYAWHIGDFTILSLAVFYLAVSRWLSYRQNIWIPVMAVLCIVFLMGILHAAGVDVFHMHERILHGYEYIYYSTLGNSNWINGFLCLVLPLFFVFYLGSETAFTGRIYLTVLVLGICMVPLCASDGIFPGLGLAAFFAVPYVLSDRRRIGRTGLLAAVLGAALVLTAVLPCFESRRYFLDGVWEQLLDLRICIPITLAGAGLAALCLLGRWELSPAVRRVLIIAGECLLGAVALAVILHTLRTYSDDWGSQRGYIWNSSLAIFRDLPPLRKLLGVGPEMLINYYGGIVTDRQVLVSHSEPIQILLTMGFMGLVLWLGAWGSLFFRCFKHRLWGKGEIAFFLPLAAYLGQSLVNSAMTTNAVLLCVFAALFRLLACDDKIST